jgi:Family of unknown function (DUF6221)
VSDEMTAWLRAQVEADKAAALAVRDNSAPWGGQWRAHRPCWLETRSGIVLAMANALGTEFEPGVVEHIAIHDPRDVIADCDAKLRLLSLHEPVEGVGGGIECEACGPNNGSPPGMIVVLGEDEFWPCATVLVLASGYRHRDGWQEEWSA